MGVEGQHDPPAHPDVVYGLQCKTMIFANITQSASHTSTELMQTVPFSFEYTSAHSQLSSERPWQPVHSAAG